MPDRRPDLILASRSPRRRQLLAEAGYRFDVVEPTESAEGGHRSGESPAEFVARMARQKAADVARRVSAGLVLGCDTVAECDGRILGKPDDEDHARAMLQTLSGREHRVFSGLCLWRVPGGASFAAYCSRKGDAEPEIRVAVTTLRMDRLGDEQLQEYLSSGGWKGKAGAFGYQDRTGWVHVIEGSESNVVGLPMELLAEMLG